MKSLAGDSNRLNIRKFDTFKKPFLREARCGGRSEPSPRLRSALLDIKATASEAIDPFKYNSVNSIDQ